jgi:glucose/arabinose dehydrogenase
MGANGSIETAADEGLHRRAEGAVTGQNRGRCIRQPLGVGAQLEVRPAPLERGDERPDVAAAIVDYNQTSVCHSARVSAPARNALPAVAATVALLFAGCGGGGGMSTPPPAAVSSGAVPAQLRVPAGFEVTIVANVSRARELAALPNGDLLVGTLGTTIALVPAAEGTGAAKTSVTFATLADDNIASVTYGPDGNVYAAGNHGVWRIGYTAGAASAGAITRIASVRTGAVSPTTDGDIHTTTSVAISGPLLYASVGSSCNACTEVDPTRASVQQMALDGSGMTTKATRLRNAIALAVDPSTGYLWAGGAGQDTLPAGHPYETFDPVSARTGVVDYGWPTCYDDALAVAGAAAGACSTITIPELVFPAYATIIGAAFYPATASGTYAFPKPYRGGMFASMHGSWHTTAGGASAAQPQVAYVPFTGGRPATAVNWQDPNAQWQPFFSNFGTTAGNRVGQPTGVAVGARGSLFIADDLTGNIYRIRPLAASPQSIRQR